MLSRRITHVTSGPATLAFLVALAVALLVAVLAVAASQPVQAPDAEVLGRVNAWARRSWAFDQFVGWLAGNDLFKGGFIVALLWWAWFAREAEAYDPTRARVITTLIGSATALLLAQALQQLLPHRARPLHELHTAFIVPFGTSQETLRNWSSFPSDHAVLFFSMATGFWLISGRLGFLVALYVSLFILGPRIYLGFHYPSDVIGGALLGMACMLLISRLVLASALPSAVLSWARRHPGPFYSIAFVVSFQISTLFDSVRSFGHLAARLLH